MAQIIIVTELVCGLLRKVSVLAKGLPKAVQCRRSFLA